MITQLTRPNERVLEELRSIYNIQGTKTVYSSLPIVGIENKDLSLWLYGILVGNIQFAQEVSETEYCDELKQILERGYFEIDYCGGALRKRIDIPKDWKPYVYKEVEETSVVAIPSNPKKRRLFRK